MRRNLFAAVLLAFCPLLMAQQAMNNDSVIKLVKAGLSDDVIVSMINSSAGTYDTSTDGVIALKTAGVSDKVISAVLSKISSTASAAAPTSSPAPVPIAPGTGDPSAPKPDSASSPVKEPLDEDTASGTGPIPAGSRVVIAPMSGFETYFAAAVREKKVPITLTLDKTSAQYFVVSTKTEWQGFVYGAGGAANWSSAGGNASYGAAGGSTRGLEASIMVVNAKTKDVVWAYEVHKSSHGALLFGTQAARGQQSLAEACAKHLKEYIEKGK
jgi:hypothetical protein